MREQEKQAKDRDLSAGSLSSIGAAEIQSYLRDIEYPAGKDELLKQAQKAQAPEGVLALIGEFPDQQYNSAVHVSQMLDRLHH